MKIRIKTPSERENRRGSWHGWFAWRPVYVYDRTGPIERRYLVWLATVERIRWRPAREKARWRYRM